MPARPQETAVKRAVVALAAVATVALSGCGANLDAQSQQWYNPAEGVGSTPLASAVAVRNVVVLTDGEGPAGVVAAFVNSGEATDSLEGVTVDGEIAELAGDTELPVGELVPMGYDDGPTAVLPEGSVDEGAFVTVEFTFDNARSVTLTTITRPAEGIWATLAPTAAPTPTPTPAVPTATPTAAPAPAPAPAPAG